MRRRLTTGSMLGLGIAASLGACTAPDLSQPCPIPDGADATQRRLALEQCFKASTSDVIDTRLKKDVDILFVIDNSTSMSPKQKALGQQIPAFIKKIVATGASYHVGVVNTDVGSLPPPGTPFSGTNEDRCNTLLGQDGKLQADACTTRVGGKYSAEFTAACNTLCPDPKFVPSGKFIAQELGLPPNVPSLKDAMGNEIGPEKAFQCIALVGDSGCGVESPLESMKRALDDHLADNKGFLRPNSVLAVIFITDEDDCSVQIAQRANLNPGSMSCPPGTADPDYKCYNLDYRCIAKNLQCDQPLSTPGVKTNCKERTDTFLESVDKYVKFLSSKKTKDKLVLAGIWTPSLLDFNSGMSTQGKLEIDTEVAGDTATQYLNRAYRAKAACYNPDPMLTTDIKGYIGQAQLRLSSFIRKFDKDVYVERSICDVTNYPVVLDQIATAITNKAEQSCLEVKPTLSSAGEPLCLVGTVSTTQDNALPDAFFPQCSAKCCTAWATAPKSIRTDPVIQAACDPEPKDCFCAPVSATKCPDTAVAGVWLAGRKDPPKDTVVSFRCAGTRPVTAASAEATGL